MAALWTIRRYEAADAAVWDALVGASRNATFLFRRGYMDYHADRFADHSLIAIHRDKPTALLPANIDGATLRSHGGLTYGGWAVPRHRVDANEMGELMDAMCDYCAAHAITEIDYKPLPHIYALEASQEDLYWLWRHGAEMTECNLSTVIDLRCNPGFNASKRQKLRKGEAVGAEYCELHTDAEIAAFHALLSSCLTDRHSARPVHSAAELMLLHSRFPGEIRFHAMKLGGTLAAGVCTFDTTAVRHLQYTATSEAGRRHDLLTPLMARLIANVPAMTRYFDFGTSNEQQGLVLNPGLIRQKWELGGSGVVYPRLRLRL